MVLHPLMNIQVTSTPKSSGLHQKQISNKHVEYSIEVHAEAVTIPQIKETHYVTLQWSIMQNSFDSPLKVFEGGRHQVHFHYSFPRVSGSIKLDASGENFSPQLSIFKLKNCNTNEVEATFNLDVASYGNKMKLKGKSALIRKDKLESTDPTKSGQYLNVHIKM